MHSPSPFTNIPSPLALFPDVHTLFTLCDCKGPRFVFHFRFSTSSPCTWSWPSTGFGGEQGHTLDDPGQFVLGKQEMRMKWSGTKFLLDDAVHFNSCRGQRLEVKWLQTSMVNIFAGQLKKLKGAKIKWNPLIRSPPSHTIWSN